MSIWTANTAIAYIGQGRTAPFRARCECQNPQTYEMEEGDFLIKAPRTNIIGDAEFFNDIAGHRLARMLGVNVASPWVVDLDNDFIADLKGTDLQQYGFKSGLAFGCDFVPNLVTMNANTPFNDSWQRQATALYAFDMLLGNDDRSLKNPNCGIKDGEILAYDFERIFSGGEQPAWKVCDHPFVARHLFHGHLIELEVDWDEFLDALARLTEQVIRSHLSDLPPSWATTSRLDKLVRHVEEARSNRTKLKDQLNKCLLKPLPLPEVK